MNRNPGSWLTIGQISLSSVMRMSCCKPGITDPALRRARNDEVTGGAFRERWRMTSLENGTSTTATEEVFRSSSMLSLTTLDIMQNLQKGHYMNKSIGFRTKARCHAKYKLMRR